MSWTILISVLMQVTLLASQPNLPEYVTSGCYGDSFNFDCGVNHQIRIKRDFFGYGTSGECSSRPTDCRVANPRTTSLVRRFCTGRQSCAYYQVERRGCNDVYTNYQQIEYQCIPEQMTRNICERFTLQTNELYISSPKFPENYLPNLDCSCFVTTNNRSEDSTVKMEVVYMSIRHNIPCDDWLRVGRNFICGMRVEWFSGKQIPVQFHSDAFGGHRGFWIHFEPSRPTDKIIIRCRNTTMRVLMHNIRRQQASMRARLRNATFTSAHASPVQPFARQVSESDSNRPSAPPDPFLTLRPQRAGGQVDNNVQNQTSVAPASSSSPSRPFDDNDDDGDEYDKDSSNVYDNDDEVTAGDDAGELYRSQSEEKSVKNEKDSSRNLPKNTVGASPRTDRTYISHFKIEKSTVPSVLTEARNPFHQDASGDTETSNLNPDKGIGSTVEEPDKLTEPTDYGMKVGITLPKPDPTHTTHTIVTGLTAEAPQGGSSLMDTIHGIQPNAEPTLEHSPNPNTGGGSVEQTSNPATDISESGYSYPSEAVIDIVGSGYPYPSNTNKEPRGQNIDELVSNHGIFSDSPEQDRSEFRHSETPSFVPTRLDQGDSFINDLPDSHEDRYGDSFAQGNPDISPEIRLSPNMEEAQTPSTTNADKPTPFDIMRYVLEQLEEAKHRKQNQRTNSLDPLFTKPTEQRVITESDAKIGRLGDLNTNTEVNLGLDENSEEYYETEVAAAKERNRNIDQNIHFPDKVVNNGSHISVDQDITDWLKNTKPKQKYTPSVTVTPLDTDRITHPSKEAESALYPEQSPELLWNQANKKSDLTRVVDTIEHPGTLNDKFITQSGNEDMLKEEEETPTDKTEINRNELFDKNVTVNPETPFTDERNNNGTYQTNSEFKNEPSGKLNEKGMDHSEEIEKANNQYPVTETPVPVKDPTVPPVIYSNENHDDEYSKKQYGERNSTRFTNVKHTVKNTTETVSKWTESVSVNKSQINMFKKDKIHQNPGIFSNKDNNNNGKITEKTNIPNLLDSYINQPSQSIIPPEFEDPETMDSPKENIKNVFGAGISRDVDGTFVDGTNPYIQELLDAINQNNNYFYDNPVFHGRDEIPLGYTPFESSEYDPFYGDYPVRAHYESIQPESTFTGVLQPKTDQNVNPTRGNQIPVVGIPDSVPISHEEATQITPKLFTVNINSERENTTLKLNETDQLNKEEPRLPDEKGQKDDKGMLAFGMIIMSIILGSGFIIVLCFVAALLCKRRKRKVSVAPRPTLAIAHARQEVIHKEENDSGRSLLSSVDHSNRHNRIGDTYARGLGHQSIVDVDNLYIKPHIKDKNIQVDIIDGYDEVRHRPLFRIEDDFEMMPSHCGPSGSHAAIRNSKAVQTQHQKRREASPPFTLRRKKFIQPTHLYTIHDSQNTESDFQTQTCNYQFKPRVPPKPVLTPRRNTQQASLQYNPKFTNSRTVKSMSGIEEIVLGPDNTSKYYRGSDPVSDAESDWESKSVLSF